MFFNIAHIYYDFKREKYISINKYGRELVAKYEKRIKWEENVRWALILGTKPFKFWALILGTGGSIIKNEKNWKKKTSDIQLINFTYFLRKLIFTVELL